MMQGSLIERAIGAAKLDPNAYEAVEHDTDATTAALTIVVLAALAEGVSNVGRNGIVGLVSGVVGGVIGWAVFAAFTYLIGVKLFATPQTEATWGQLLRTTGFAHAPAILNILGIIPVPGLDLFVALITAIWVLLATIVAIRQALDFTTLRAIGTAVVATLAEVFTIFIIGSLFVGLASLFR
ncbi:YIP1 family protein [Thermorudis peleae]|uniref:YIP1 family protein n=1 Tax=Thermorudis peleae TaxID=1382356 RepID=UPI000571C6F5|nr:YIP1 family protein [Thermorudis peleae]